MIPIRSITAGFLAMFLFALGGDAVADDAPAFKPPVKAPAAAPKPGQPPRPDAPNASSTQQPAAAPPVAPGGPALPEPSLASPEELLGPLPTLGVEQVTPLLSLSPQQRQQIQGIIQSARNDMQVLAKGAQQLPPGQRDLKLPVIKERIKLVMAGYRRKLESVLTPAQGQRLQEVSLQVRGLAAVNDPEVGEALRLTEEQKAQVAAASEEAAAIKRNIDQSARPLDRYERKGRRQAKRQTKRQLQDQIGSILTPEQLDQFAQMQGPRLGIGDLLRMQTNIVYPGGPPGPNGPNGSNEPGVDLGEPRPDLGEPKPDLGEPKPDLGEPKPDLGNSEPAPAAPKKSK